MQLLMWKDFVQDLEYGVSIDWLCNRMHTSAVIQLSCSLAESLILIL